MFIKANGILHISRCTVNQIETELQRAFLMSNFVCFRLLLLWVYGEKLAIMVLCC